MFLYPLQMWTLHLLQEWLCWRIYHCGGSTVFFPLSTSLVKPLFSSRCPHLQSTILLSTAAWGPTALNRDSSLLWHHRVCKQPLPDVEGEIMGMFLLCSHTACLTQCIHFSHIFMHPAVPRQTCYQQHMKDQDGVLQILDRLSHCTITLWPCRNISVQTLCRSFARHISWKHNEHQWNYFSGFVFKKWHFSTYRVHIIQK